MLKKKTVGVS